MQINSLYVTYTYYPAVIYANADAAKSDAKNEKEKKIDKQGSPLDLESRSIRDRIDSSSGKGRSIGRRIMNR